MTANTESSSRTFTGQSLDIIEFICQSQNDICESHEERPCLNGLCPLSRCDQNFLWIVKRPRENAWCALRTQVNLAIEEAFSDPRVDNFVLFWDDKRYVIYFDSLMQKNRMDLIRDPFEALEISARANRQLLPLGDFQYVRLSYKSVGEATLKWNWFFKADSNEHTASAGSSIEVLKPIIAKIFPKSSVVRKTGTGNYKPWMLFDELNANSLESAYNGSYFEVIVNVSNQKYLVDFATMTQKNTTSGKSRMVKRRPELTVLEKSERHYDQQLIPEFGSVEMPQFFSCRNGFNEKILSKKTDFEYSLLCDSIVRRMPTAKNIKITRIENFELFAHYYLKRGQMMRKFGSVSKLNEALLFHGTSAEAALKIAKDNFDWRLAGSHVGQRFGAGVYFTPDVNYASGYCSRNQSDKCIIVGLVLIGDYTLGSSSIKRPPEKRDLPDELYDSCVNDLLNPSIYVIFDHNQMYPLYKINFSL